MNDLEKTKMTHQTQEENILKHNTVLNLKTQENKLALTNQNTQTSIDGIVSLTMTKVQPFLPL